MKKIKVFLSVVLLSLSALAFAQNITVSGRITDASNGESVPMATVLVKGTATGVVADLEGNYSIKVAKSATLVFSSVGYTTVETPISGRAKIDVALSPDAQYLDDVVVTALGISREKKSLGYAVQDLKSDELVQAAATSLSSALTGKLSGVDIVASSGMPGASAKITIRGSRSLDGNNTPLYVIDGMPVASTPDMGTGDSVTGADYAGRSIDIDPNDIESINVLKGQAASALYGMRASNGVIVITTKKGSSAGVGKTSVTFTTNHSFDKVAALPEVQTEYGMGSYGEFQPTSSYAWGPKISALADDPNYGGNTANKYTDADGLHKGMYYVPQRAAAGVDPWAVPQAYDNMRSFFRTGYTNSNNVSVAHNTGNGSMIFSLGNTNTTGIVPSTGLARYNARFGAESKLSKYFTLGFNASYIQSSISKQSGANDGMMNEVFCCPSSYDLAGIPYHYANDPYTQTNFRSTTFNNPYWAAENNSFTESNQRFFGNAYLDFKTDFNTGGQHKLDVKYQIGADAYSTSYEDLFGYGSKGGLGEITEQILIENTTNSLITANYSWKINEDMNFSAMVGNEIVYDTETYLYGYGAPFNFAGWNSLNNVASYDSSNSYGQSLTFGTFGEVAFDYKNMLFVNATLRSDYVSSMPNGNRTFTYPSISAGFIFTELDELKNDILTFGKVRASYAEVGQAGVYSPSFFSTPGYGGGFSSGTPVVYPIGGVTAYTPYTLIYDPDLRPQNTKSYEFGTDLAFYDGKFTLSYTYSRQNVKDQIFDVPMASSTGYTYKRMNAGRVHTNAHEATIGIVPIETKDFTWDININFSKIDNYVDELAEGVESIMLGGFVEPQIRAGIGDKYPCIYGYDYARNEDGVVIVDEDGFPMAGDLAVIGTVAPDFQVGLSTGFNWKGLRFNMVFDWKKGGSMYAGTYTMMDYYGISQRSADYRNMDSFMFDYEPSVKIVGTNADGSDKYAKNDIKIPGEYAQDYFSVLNDISKVFVNDASYLKLREVSASYPVVNAKWGSVSLNLFARNLLLWSAIKGFDPEASQGNNNMTGGFERFSLPGTSSFGGGLTFKF